MEKLDFVTMDSSCSSCSLEGSNYIRTTSVGKAYNKRKPALLQLRHAYLQHSLWREHPARQHGLPSAWRPPGRGYAAVRASEVDTYASSSDVGQTLTPRSILASSPVGMMATCSGNMRADL